MRLAIALCLGLLCALPARAKVYAGAMIAAANPLAVESGLKVLRAGGSAVDAAVAIQATLGLVEPQSSGLGGGAFMTVYDARTRRVTAYDGRETAPAGATPDMFQRPDGSTMTKGEAILSGRSAGVPGAMAMLALAQKEHGRLPWRDLFGDAERLASDGFAVSPRLAGMIAGAAPQARAPDTVAYFTNPDGSRMKAGDRLVNRAYAATLRRLAKEGPTAILSGPVAADIVARLAKGPLPGTMTLADLAAWRPREGEALCRPYRAWTICAPDAPSGGPATLEGMGLLARTDIAAHGPADPVGWLLLAQAERLMYVDDARYIADPAFVTVPVAGLLDPAYLDERARSIGDERPGPAPAPGHPVGAPKVGADATREPGGTSSFVVVDRWGEVVSITTTVESVFGDGRMVDGFFLNNQLTDFSFSPRDADGTPAANAVGPGKRPRSSMSPVIVLDGKRRFVAAVGSPGGPAIPSYVMKVLVGVLDWKLSMPTAIALPNLIAFGDFYLSEPERFLPGVVAGLAARGVTLRSSFAAEGSGLHGIVVTSRGLEGGADPRREGVVRRCC
ncbi:MAG: gamma-glutamyltransferase family protein [Caulobacteraceae bacterium]